MYEKIIKKTVLLLDGDFLLYYATMGNKVLDNDGNPVRQDNKFVYTDKTLEEVIKCADDIINNILDRCNADYYIGYLGNSKSFRFDIYPEYKAKRKIDKPLWFNELKEYLSTKWKFILLNNRLEADDAVNIARNLLKDKYNIFITTTDKDLIKCIPGKYINAKDLSIIRTSKEKACLAFWTSMITGDGVDNIQGLKGCGKVFAEKLFKDSTDYHLDVIKAYNSKLSADIAGKEYAKNYQLLYILDEFDGFEVELIARKEDSEDREGDSRECAEKDTTSLW